MNKQDDMFDEDSESQGGWIQWFCKLDDHNYFCEIEPDFFLDSLNTYGLKHYFEDYE